MALEHKNAAGIFPDRQHTESALDQLKAADFPMNDELQQAQTVLKTQGIQDWIIFDTL